MEARTGQRRTNRSNSATHVVEWAILGALGLLVIAACFSGTVRDAGVATSTVKVRQGDTLWDLASRTPVRGLNTAEKVDLIADLNGLDSATLTVGSVLKVPAIDAAGDVLAMK